MTGIPSSPWKPLKGMLEERLRVIADHEMREHDAAAEERAFLEPGELVAETDHRADDDDGGAAKNLSP